MPTRPPTAHHLRLPPAKGRPAESTGRAVELPRDSDGPPSTGAGLSIATVSTIGANDGGRERAAGAARRRASRGPAGRWAPPASGPAGFTGGVTVSWPRERHDLGAVSHGRVIAGLSLPGHPPDFSQLFSALGVFCVSEALIPYLGDLQGGVMEVADGLHSLPPIKWHQPSAT